MEKLLKKIIAVLLVMTMTGANLLLLGTYTVSYALSESEITEQMTNTENKNVEFNTYLEGEKYIKTLNVDSKDTKLYLNIKVKDAGYLKSGEIILENVNFKISEEIQNNYIKNIDIENNKITLKQINNGSDVTIEIPIEILDTHKIPEDNFAKDIKAKFSGIYIDASGKEKNVSNEIVNRILWNCKANAEMNTNLTKYIPYEENGIYGVFVQTKIEVGIKDSKLPIKNTELEVIVPTLNETKPSKVTVIANTTSATNGNTSGVDFVSDNYSYNKETGIITINVQNKVDSEGRISWVKNEKDGYLVNFVFEGQEYYQYCMENGFNSKVKVLAQITTYNSEKNILEVSNELEISESKTLGTVTDYDIYVQEHIEKGYMYANYISNEKEETNYWVKYRATINSLDLADTIEIKQEYDKMIIKEGKEFLTTIQNENYAYNKTIKVSEKEFTKILGQDGNIDILDYNENKLECINKDTQKDDEGNYVIDITSFNNNRVIIKTSKPISIGTIDLKIEKAVKGETGYTEEQVKSFIKMQVSLVGISDEPIKASKEILFKEPASTAQIEISNKDLTTIAKNKNIEIRATLDTSSIGYSLYKNPTLEIELPSYITKVEINNSNILMDGGLKIKEVNVKKEDGKQVIYVTLEGTQKEYTINAKYKGTIIVLNTDLTVETFTPSNTSKIEMTYTNKNTVSLNGEGKTSTNVNFVAPKDVVAANGVDKVISVSDEVQNIEIKPYSDKKTVTINGKVINNYSNSISNVVILGRLPVKDNKKIDTEEALGSNFDTILKSEIKLTGVEASNYIIYYSENQNATKSVLDTNNNWTESVIENAKSYLIVFNNYEMQAGTGIDFSYEVEIPENLKHNSDVYEMYKIYFNNNSSIGNIEETKISPIIKITTGQGPDLLVELKPSVDVVRQGQIVKMLATIKNTGDIKATNVKVNIPLPEYATFVECIGGQGIYDEDIKTKIINVGTLEPNQTEKVSYYIRLDDGKNEEASEVQFPKEIVNILKVTFDELSEGISSNEIKLDMQQGDIAIELYSPVPETQVLKKDEIIEYRMVITNISDNKTLNNGVVTLNLPEGIEYVSSTIGDELIGITTNGATYDSNSRTLKISLGTLNKYQYVSLQLKVGELEDNFAVMAKVKADGTEESYSNVVEYEATKIELEISELSSTPRYVKENEELVYILTITNKSKAAATELIIVDELPEGLEFEKATYTYGKDNDKISTINLVNGKVVISINSLEAGEQTKVEITAKANLLPDRNDKEIKNKVSVSAKGFTEVNTNTVTNIIEYDDEAHKKDQDEQGSQGTQNEQGSQNGGNGTETTVEKRYKITGIAWIDANQDGKRDSGEEILSNVPVLLLDKKDNSIVKDIETDEEKRTITLEDGKYEFDDLPVGEYLVVFAYDASRYSLTTYQAKDVDTSLNSDAIDMNMVLDGERKVVGMTDIISIKDSHARDIDIGVYVSEKFDLRLDKYIEKITLTTPTIGTKTYNYTNKQAAKIEVLGKNVGQSSIVIEYKIVVTNEGAVSGYVKKVVDYLPENLKFSTELNKDWYLSENGNVYNSSLENTKINPGESKELTLVATMKITENTLDVLNNNAEIYESYNEKGLADIDSTVANKIGTEDDMSKADVVVSLVTGTIIKYITLALGVITIFGLGVYGIKNKVLLKKKKRRR